MTLVNVTHFLSLSQVFKKDVAQTRPALVTLSVMPSLLYVSRNISQLSRADTHAYARCISASFSRINSVLLC